jgi:hypothetical protein
MKKLISIIAILATACVLQAQQSPGACNNLIAPMCRDSQTISTSAASITVQGNGGLVATFEEIIAGSPSTVSVVIKGCGDAGVCTTLDTYATVANATRSPAISTPYAYYTVTATWTGGSGVSVTVNTRETTAALPGDPAGAAATAQANAEAASVPVAVVPQGAWTQTTPTPTCGSGAATSISSTVRVSQIGKTASFNILIQDGTNGTCAGSLNVALPFTAQSRSITYCYEYNATASADLAYVLAGSSTLSVYAAGFGFAGGNGYYITCSGVVETQ